MIARPALLSCRRKKEPREARGFTGARYLSSYPRISASHTRRYEPRGFLVGFYGSYPTRVWLLKRRPPRILIGGSCSVGIANGDRVCLTGLHRRAP